MTGTSGKGVLTASILLGIMILPTIIGVSESAIRAVPESYYEGALALGDTHERSVFCAVLPAAKSGIMAGVILGCQNPPVQTFHYHKLPVAFPDINENTIPQYFADMRLRYGNKPLHL